jgi:peptidoglycan/LPS O-acetylase OafA/YrhL
MMEEPGLRHNNIDALRLILAVLVIFSHSYVLGTGSEAAEPLLRATRGQLTLGALAVDWFFVLSGFLIAQSWERIRALGPFLVKRARRIYPGFIVAVAVCSWVVVPLARPTADTFTLSHLVDFLWTVPRLLTPAYFGAFGVYLYAFPIQQLIVQWSGGRMSQQALFWSALQAGLVAGAAS